MWEVRERKRPDGDTHQDRKYRGQRGFRGTEKDNSIVTGKYKLRFLGMMFNRAVRMQRYKLEITCSESAACEGWQKPRRY